MVRDLITLTHALRQDVNKMFEQKHFKHHRSVCNMLRRMDHELKSESITKPMVRANGFQRVTTQWHAWRRKALHGRAPAAGADAATRRRRCRIGAALTYRMHWTTSRKHCCRRVGLATEKANASTTASGSGLTSPIFASLYEKADKKEQAASRSRLNPSTERGGSSLVLQQRGPLRIPRSNVKT